MSGNAVWKSRMVPWSSNVPSACTTSVVVGVDGLVLLGLYAFPEPPAPTLEWPPTLAGELLLLAALQATDASVKPKDPKKTRVRIEDIR